MLLTRHTFKNAGMALRVLAPTFLLLLKNPPRLLRALGKSFRVWYRGGLSAVKAEIRNHVRGKTHEVSYGEWVLSYDTLTNDDRALIRARIDTLAYRPPISVVMPVYDIDETWLRKAIDSVTRQLYPNWELCIADDCSPKPHVRTVLEEYTARDTRIKVVLREQHGGIVAASNSAFELAEGEFTAFLDHDDELTEHALYMIAEELNSRRNSDLIYSDEDKIDEAN